MRFSNFMGQDAYSKYILTCNCHTNLLKAFSSIKCVHTTYITWDWNDWKNPDLCADREAVKRYEELSDIFSEKDNYSQSRELLKEVSHTTTQWKTHLLYQTCMWMHWRVNSRPVNVLCLSVWSSDWTNCISSAGPDGLILPKALLQTNKSI